MRRVFGVVLVGLGIFGIVFAGVVRYWVYPNGLKTPLDLNIPIIATGPAQVFNANNGQLDSVTLRADRTVKVDSQASNSKAVVVQERLCIVIQIDNPPPCVSSTDKQHRLLTYTTDRVAADRKSALAIDDPKYGGNVNGDTSIKHVGLTYKWPFHSKKKTYPQFFNPDVGEAFPATYEGTEKIAGLKTYKYVVVTPQTEADVFKGIPGNYVDTQTIWVEPETGTIVKGSEHQLRTFRGGDLDGKTAVELTLTFDDATVKFQANKAKDGRKLIKLVSFTLPLAALVVGVLALAGGVWLLARRDRQSPDGGAEPQSWPEPQQGPSDQAVPQHAAGPPPPGGTPDYEVTRPIQR